ncbi:hypothetical protein B296_00052709 [Ensete ventricosum]|uniref:MCAfunc domain-containing protein n=1 Tax=Ensete ventricosum TaxID=4639 RepID=A0A426Y9B8_ENSVE|nr:hypothetical protein B296_00052709 [Ensete ventricosum]
MALIGDLTTVAQLIGKISDAVSTARNLPQVCRRFAGHLQDIGRHLEPLKSAELDEATRQTLANLQRTLEWSYDVIVNCSRRSYAYRLIRGKSIRDKIREAQDEVDRILRLFPLIQLSQDYGYRPSYCSSDDEEKYDSEDEYSDEEPRSGKIVEEYAPKFRELSLNANANVKRTLNEEWVEDDNEYDHEESNEDDNHEESNDDDDDNHEESNDDDDDREESDDDDDNRKKSNDYDDDREESNDDDCEESDEDDDREESDEDETEEAFPNLRIFAFKELKSATRSFQAANMIGEGGFGVVYKGWVDKKTLTPGKYGVGMAVAVKKWKPESFQGSSEWQLGTEGATMQPLSWEQRLKIAIGAARGLAFLHAPGNRIIHRNFTSSRVLLDSVSRLFFRALVHTTV